MTAEIPVGLFDMPCFDDMVKTVCDVFASNATHVAERLFREAVDEGESVREAAARMGVTPHVFDQTMASLYSKSDAFIYELLAAHCRPETIAIDRRVVQSVSEHLPDRLDSRILCFGDGIGSDSLRFATAGYSVTYYEFEGYSSRLAQHRFSKAGVAPRIQVISKEAELPRESFDVVICREVLEHVPDPISLVRVIQECLCYGGIAILTESFARVEGKFPTHLRSNVRYAGRMIPIFMDFGGMYEGRYAGRPYIFTKKTNPDQVNGLTRLNLMWWPKIRRGGGKLKRVFAREKENQGIEDSAQ